MVQLYSFPNNIEVQVLPKPNELAMTVFLENLQIEYPLVYLVFLQGKMILSNFTYEELRSLPLNKDDVPVVIDWDGKRYNFNLIKKLKTSPPYTSIFEIRIDDRIIHGNVKRGVKYFRLFFFPDEDQGLATKICLYDSLEKDAVDLDDFNRANKGNMETTMKINNGITVQKRFRRKRELFDVYLR